MGEGWQEADLCGLALAGTHTKYGFTLMLGDTNSNARGYPVAHTHKNKTNKPKKPTPNNNGNNNNHQKKII